VVGKLAHTRDDAHSLLCLNYLGNHTRSRLVSVTTESDASRGCALATKIFISFAPPRDTEVQRPERAETLFTCEPKNKNRFLEYINPSIATSGIIKVSFIDIMKIAISSIILFLSVSRIDDWRYWGVRIDDGLDTVYISPEI
jgi:hypothetical protein